VVWIDIVILGIVAVSVLFGVVRGAIRTVFSIVGVVVAFLVATRESGAVGVVLSNWMDERVAAAVGFVIVFLGIAIAFALVGWLLRKLLQGLALSWMDRTAGAVLGFLRGAVIVGVLALAIEALHLEPSKDSITYPLAVRAGLILLSVVPEETIERLDWERLKEWLPDRLPDGADDFI
jgi:membrane protein required for colicin V production